MVRKIYCQLYIEVALDLNKDVLWEQHDSVALRNMHALKQFILQKESRHAEGEFENTVYIIKYAYYAQQEFQHATMYMQVHTVSELK